MQPTKPGCMAVGEKLALLEIVARMKYAHQAYALSAGDDNRSADSANAQAKAIAMQELEEFIAEMQVCEDDFEFEDAQKGIAEQKNYTVSNW